MTVPNTLADIISKVRLLTARPTAEDMLDSTIINYINTYYLYDMPETLRLMKLEDTYSFITEPNVEVYTFENTINDNPAYITVSDPVYVAGQQMQYFQDPDIFYREWPKINYIEQVSFGDGTLGPYIGSLTQTPFLPSVNTDPITNIISKLQQVLITANIGNSQSTSAIDDGEGNLISPTDGSLLGTIDYLTGAFEVEFEQPVPPSNAINAEYIPYVASLPRCILFFQNQFFLRPVPDKSYTVQLKAFRFPTALMSNGQSPELQQWWQVLAYGAAIKIMTDNGDFDNGERLRPYLDEQIRFVQRRTIKLRTSQRTSTIYSDSGIYPFSNLYPYI